MFQLIHLDIAYLIFDYMNMSDLYTLYNTDKYMKTIVSNYIHKLDTKYVINLCIELDNLKKQLKEIKKEINNDNILKQPYNYRGYFD